MNNFFKNISIVNVFVALRATTFKAPAESKTDAVNIALIRKINVATNERFERRAIPDNACPLVHPPAHALPKPTQNPAMTNLNLFLTEANPASGIKCESPTNSKATEVNNNPNRKVFGCRFKEETNIGSPVLIYLVTKAVAKNIPPTTLAAGVYAAKEC